VCTVRFMLHWRLALHPCAKRLIISPIENTLGVT
jgi:hypothetical protein